MRLIGEFASYSICLTLLLAHAVVVFGDYFEECDNEPNLSFIASPRGCNFYIFCNGEDSYDGDCGEGFYFNNAFKSCDPENEVECRLPSVTNATAVVPGESSLQTISTTEAVNSTSSLAVTNSTMITITAPTAASTTISTMTPLTTESITQVTVTSNAAQTSAASSSAHTLPTPHLPTTCPTSDNPNQIVYLANPKSCSDYFVCYHGQMISMHCSPMLHFNTHTNKCDYPEKALCKADLSSPKEQCHTHTLDLFPYARNCNYFYYCKNGYLMLQQCPIGFGWDYQKRACVSMKEAKCYSQENRL